MPLAGLRDSPPTCSKIGAWQTVAVRPGERGSGCATQLTSQVEVLQAELQVERHRVQELMEALARESRERETLMRQAAELNAAMRDALKQELLEALRAEAKLQTTARQEQEERDAAAAKSTSYAIQTLQARATATETLDDKLEARLEAAEGLLASYDTTVTKLVHSTTALGTCGEPVYTSPPLSTVSTLPLTADSAGPLRRGADRQDGR